MAPRQVFNTFFVMNAPNAVKKIAVRNFRINTPPITTYIWIGFIFLCSLGLLSSPSSWACENKETINSSVISGVSSEEESVQIVPTDLSIADLFRIWARIGNNAYQLSIPCIARVVHLES